MTISIWGCSGLASCRPVPFFVRQLSCFSRSQSDHYLWETVENMTRFRHKNAKRVKAAVAKFRANKRSSRKPTSPSKGATIPQKDAECQPSRENQPDPVMSQVFQKEFAPAALETCESNLSTLTLRKKIIP
jgi:hypothetical protein